MSETFFEGPAIALGPLIGGGVSKQGNPWSGPGAEYQGACVLDPRYYPANKDGVGSGRIQSFMNHSYFVMADNIPSAFGTATLAALQPATASGTPFTLTSVSPGGSGPGVPSLACTVPMIPSTGGVPIQVLASDFGFTTGTTVAGNATITVPDSTLFQPGQWLCIGGAGNVAKTASLLTQVLTLASATTITVSNAPAGSLTNAPIGSANLYGLFPSGAAPTAVNPYVNGGALQVFNPLEGLARCASVTGSASATGGNVIITGYDIANVLMHETIAAPASATTVYGKKAFKYFVSAVPQFTDAGHNYSVGLGDTFGFHTRSDKWEYTNIFYAGAFSVNSGGWIPGLSPATPSTNTTADVRGTIQVSANGVGVGAGTGIISNSASTNGTNRLTLFMTIPVFNMLNATPANLISLFGNPQA
jgi:hypothetical protein